MSWKNRCFEAALHLWFKDQTFTVVHGYPIGRGPENFGKRYVHAWVERDGWVWDLTIDPDPVPRQFFYALGELTPEHVYRFRPSVVRRNVHKFKHYGPWAGPEKCPPVAKFADE